MAEVSIMDYFPVRRVIDEQSQVLIRCREVVSQSLSVVGKVGWFDRLLINSLKIGKIQSYLA